jgi:hypothetical protein
LQCGFPLVRCIHIKHSERFHPRGGLTLHHHDRESGSTGGLSWISLLTRQRRHEAARARAAASGHHRIRIHSILWRL